jgi:hypothetical protein
MTKQAATAMCAGATLGKPKWPHHPQHPERICWGCDKYCSADDLRCGNGTIRTPHPVELFGEDWLEWEIAETAPSLDENDHCMDGRELVPE